MIWCYHHHMGQFFITLDWLRLVQAQTKNEFLPLMFYKGSHLVAIYPIFIQKQGLINIALSPPSRSIMLYLGPLIADYESLKQDKKESTYIQIQKELDRYIFGTKGCRYARIRTAPGLYDSRPLRWSGYTLVAYYTYRIDLTEGIDHVWKQFDVSVRRGIHESQKDGVTIRTGDRKDIEFIRDTLNKRYLQQGITPVNNRKYILDIYNKFFSDNIKIFVAEYEGQKIGGCIYLCFKKIMYAWLGAPKTDLVSISPNELIQWEAIKWAQANGFRYYEIMDAGDDARLRHSKAKYNPDLVIWYSATKYSSFLYKIIEQFYNFKRKKRHLAIF